jgi:hypothetical protein
VLLVGSRRRMRRHHPAPVGDLPPRLAKTVVAILANEYGMFPTPIRPWIWLVSSHKRGCVTGPVRLLARDSCT